MLEIKITDDGDAVNVKTEGAANLKDLLGLLEIAKVMLIKEYEAIE